MKIKSISFGDIPFRMFRNLTINISERLTVIAGHNGIGKSTLVKLIEGDLIPLSGEVRRNQRLRIGKYSQHFVDKVVFSTLVYNI